MRLKFAALILVVFLSNTVQAASEADSAETLVKESSPAGATAVGQWRSPNEDLNLKQSGLKMVQGLGLVIGCLLIGSYLARRYLPNQAGVGARRMKVLERLTLSSKAALLLVEVESQRFVVAVGSEKISLLPAAVEQFDEELSAVCSEPIKLSA